MAIECNSPNSSPPNTPSPHELIRRYKLDLKKSLGQNLLIDATHLARIADAADLTPADTVLEIGPGLGALTRQLAAQAGRVVAVELDQRLIPILREQFAAQPHVSFVHADILELDPCSNPGRRTARCRAGALLAPRRAIQGGGQSPLLHYERGFAPYTGSADTAFPGRPPGAA